MAKRKLRLLDYYDFTKQHPKTNGKERALQIIDGFLLNGASKLRSKAHSIKKLLLNVDGKIRLTFLILDKIETNQRIMNVLKKYFKIGKRSKIPVAKRKVMRGMKALPMRRKRELQKNLIKISNRFNTYPIPLEAFFNEAETKIANLKTGRMILAEWHKGQKIKGECLVGVTTNTSFIDLPGITQVMTELFKLFSKIENAKCPPKDDFDRKDSKQRAIKNTINVVRTYWTLQRGVADKQIRDRIDKCMT